MSLNSRERRALTAIEQSLSATAPELESLLAMFNRLVEGEAMPVRRRNRRRLPPAARGRRSRPRRATGPYGRASGFCALERFSHACVVLWLAVSAALVAVAVALSGVGPRACPVSWASGCCQTAHPAASGAPCHRP